MVGCIRLYSPKLIKQSGWLLDKLRWIFLKASSGLAQINLGVKPCQCSQPCHPCQPYNGNITWLCQFFSKKQRRVCSKLGFCAWFPTFKLAHLERFVRLMSTSRASLNNFGGLKNELIREKAGSPPPHTKKNWIGTVGNRIVIGIDFFHGTDFIRIRNFICSLCAYWPRFVPGSKAFWFDNTFRNALP